MSSSHESRPPRPRPTWSGLSLEARLDAALRPPVSIGGLEDRIIQLTGADLRRAGQADARLARRIEAELVPDHVVPADLEPRVHAASVGGLPVASEPVLVGVGVGVGPGHEGQRSVVGRIARARTLAGRLAMAASFGVLALAGWWTTRPEATVPSAVPVDRVLAASHVEDLSWSSLEDTNAVEAELALLDSWDVGSYADVAGEIEAMIPDVLRSGAR